MKILDFFRRPNGKLWSNLLALLVPETPAAGDQIPRSANKLKPQSFFPCFNIIITALLLFVHTKF